MGKLRGFEVLPEFADYFNGERAKQFDEPVVQKPARQTLKAAGHDICSIENIVIAPGKKVDIATGITSYMQDDEVLYIFVRSGMAFKKNATLQNAVGVIDSDFYGGHIKVLLRNEGTEPLVIHVGDRIAQGVFQKFLVADDDSENEKVDRQQEVVGGLGHTGI